MKLKAFKIWLFLLPVVGIIGVLLFVQSTNNQTELQQQHIRSIASLSKDIQLALPDYLKRVEALLQRQGYIDSPLSPINTWAASIQEIRSGFRPRVSNLRFVDSATVPKVEVSLDSTLVLVKNHPVVIPPPYDLAFRKAVSKNPRFSGESVGNTVLLMDIEIPIRELFENVLANDFVFEKFYLTKSTGVVLYPEEQIGNKLFDPKAIASDSSKLTYSGITSSRIVLDGKEYLAYENPFHLGPNKLYFVGLYDSTYFMKVGLRINFNLLSSLLFILVLLIASIPILGVLKMGRGDNMTQSRIIQVGISLMIIAVVVGFWLSFSKNRPIPSQLLESTIMKSGDELKSNLDRFKLILDNWIDQEGIAIPSQTNELIQVNSETGYVKDIIFYSKNEIKPLRINFEGDTSFIYLKDRAYIKHFASTKKNPTFLDSHYSRGTGQLESVMAFQDPVSSKSRISAVTFSLELDSALSHSNRILLIKEDGKVIFKSKKVESSISNLSESINPDKWKEVSSLLKNNREIEHSIFLEVPLYLNGHQYEGIFRRIGQQHYDKELWEVFLVNANVFHAFSALTSLEGVILLGFYFFFFLMTLFAQWSTRTGASSKGFKSFFFEWLVPNEKNQPRIIYLMGGYFIFAVTLLALFKSTAFNPVSTLAFLTYSSLNISIINLASAQVARMSEEKKITTELLVLLGILFLVFSLISLVFQGLIIGMIILSTLSFSIILGWSILRKRKGEISFLKSIKSSKNTLSAYLVFWFFLIGFLPGYLIQSKTQQFESMIWNQSLRSQNDPSELVLEYEKIRREMMVTLADPFDFKIQDFIAPDQKVLQGAWDGTTSDFSTKPIVYFSFFLLVLATYLVVRWIQKSIFFDLRPQAEVYAESGYAPNYICCINSNQIPLPDPETVIIDLKFSTFPDDFVAEAKYYRLVNFHCVENPMALVKPISQIKNSHCGITIYSGALWKNIYTLLKTEREKSIFSELFSDFKFSVIEIEDVVKGPFRSEDEVLSRLKRNKAFYTNIWSDLSFEEKLVCHSYAKEGFFNPARKDTMLDLAQKGIIVHRNYASDSNIWIEWKLFSSVFRHYILTHSSEEESASFGAYEKKHGNVRTIQTAVISFVLICIALVGIFDKTFFNEAYAYLTGGLGVLGTLYSFLNQGFAGLRGAKKEG